MKTTFTNQNWASKSRQQGMVQVPTEVAAYVSQGSGLWLLGVFQVLRGDGSKSRAILVSCPPGGFRTGEAVVKIVG